jgi:hypothetical protein
MNDSSQQKPVSTNPSGSRGLTFQEEEQKRPVNSAWRLLKTMSEIAVASSAVGVAPTMASTNQLQYVYMMIQNNFLETHKALHDRINLMTDDRVQEGSIAVNEFSLPSHGHSSPLVQDSKGFFSPYSPPVSFSKKSSSMEVETSSSSSSSSSSSTGLLAGLTAEPRPSDGGVTKVTSLPLSSLKRLGEPHLSSRDENEGLTDEDGNSLPPKIRQLHIKQMRNQDGSHRLVGSLNPSSPAKTDSFDAYYLNLELNMYRTLQSASTAALTLQATVTENGLDSLTIKAINTFTNTFLQTALRNVNMFFGPRNSSLWRTPLKFNSRRGIMPTSVGISSKLSALQLSSTLASQGGCNIDLSTDVDGDNDTVQFSKVHDVDGMDKIVPRQERRNAHSLLLNAVALSNDDVSILASCLFPFTKKQRTALLQLCKGGPHGIAGKVDKYSVSWEKLQCLVDEMWINDEVINFVARSVSLEIHTVGVWVTLSTFYWSLAEHGKPPDYSFANANKLTNKENINITTLKTVIIPLHVVPNHWVVIVINLEQESIHYFDSLNAPQDTITVALGDVYVPQTNVNGPLRRYGPALRNCARWVVDEFSATSVIKDVREWKGIVHSQQEVPQQNNGYDCGVFCMHMVKTFAEGKGPCFQMGGIIDDPNIPLMRRQIALSIIKTSSLPDADAAAPASAPSSSDYALPQTQLIA